MVMGIEGTNDKSGKDGYTVKKLIALLLVVAFVCSATVGCGGGTTPAAKPAPSPGAPGAPGAGGGKTP